MLLLTDRLALGTVQFGLDYGINNTRGKVAESEVRHILRAAASERVGLLDTAAAYGSAQRVLGRCLGASRRAFKVVSKIAPTATQPKQVALSFGRILADLRCGALYGLLVHDFAGFTRDPRNWDVLVDLRTKGRVEKIGYSLYYPSQLDWLMQHNVDFDIVQVPYNILDQRFAEAFPALRAREIEIHVRSVFLQGLFFMPTRALPSFFRGVVPKLEAVHKLAESNNIPVCALLLGFALSNDSVTRAIVGVHDVDELRENIRGLEHIDLARTLKADLDVLEHDDERVLLPFNWPST